jgi:hypothetical protein
VEPDALLFAPESLPELALAAAELLLGAALLAAGALAVPVDALDGGMLADPPLLSLLLAPVLE